MPDLRSTKFGQRASREVHSQAAAQNHQGPPGIGLRALALPPRVSTLQAVDDGINAVRNLIPTPIAAAVAHGLIWPWFVIEFIVDVT